LIASISSSEDVEDKLSTAMDKSNCLSRNKREHLN
jgi:hypothetical protein